MVQKHYIPPSTVYIEGGWCMPTKGNDPEDLHRSMPVKHNPVNWKIAGKQILSGLNKFLAIATIIPEVGPFIAGFGASVVQPLENYLTDKGYIGYGEKSQPATEYEAQPPQQQRFIAQTQYSQQNRSSARHTRATGF